ncbi:uncharacterized, partial [Tachysurus ichikawai]
GTRAGPESRTSAFTHEGLEQGRRAGHQLSHTRDSSRAGEQDISFHTRGTRAGLESRTSAFTHDGLQQGRRAGHQLSHTRDSSRAEEPDNKLFKL